MKERISYVRLDYIDPRCSLCVLFVRVAMKYERRESGTLLPLLAHSGIEKHAFLHVSGLRTCTFSERDITWDLRMLSGAPVWNTKNVSDPNFPSLFYRCHCRRTFAMPS